MVLKMPPARPAVFIGLIFLMGNLCFVAAQEENGEGDGAGDEIPIESDYEGPLPGLYGPGDQLLRIGAGTVFPTVFLDDQGQSYTHNVFPVGGMLLGAYSYFLTPHWFVGGEANFTFIATLNTNLLYMVPFGLLGGYQFVLGRFEFPVSFMLGMAAQQYLNQGHFSFLFLKPEAGVYWRYNHEWSFGLNTAWWFVPEWPGDASKSRYGNFVETSLSVRFHF